MKDCDKLDELYRIYEQPMYRIAYAILHHTEQAEDAVSDAFVQIIKNIKKLKSMNEQETKKYMTTVIKHTAIDQYRKNVRSQEHTTPDVDENSMGNLKDEKGEQAYRSVEMYSVMDNLDAGDRNIIMMRCNEEKSFKDIGDVLGISEAAARKRFERARKQLTATGLCV